MRSRSRATRDEATGAVVGDELVPRARLVATRSITIEAPPDEVFPWLRQMGFGRAGWYSWDLIDNLGRRSANTVHPEWQGLVSGDSVPGGPIDFEATVVEPPRALVIRVAGDGLAHGNLLVLPFGIADQSIGVAVADLDQLLDRMLP